MSLDLSQFTHEQILLAVCRHALDLIDKENLRKFQEAQAFYKREALALVEAKKAREEGEDDGLGFMERAMVSGSATALTSWYSTVPAKPPLPVNRTGLQMKVVAAIRNCDNLVFRSLNVNGYDLALDVNLTNLREVNTAAFNRIYGQYAFEDAVEPLRYAAPLTLTPTNTATPPTKQSGLRRPQISTWAKSLFILSTRRHDSASKTDPSSPLSPASSVSAHSPPPRSALNNS